VNPPTAGPASGPGPYGAPDPNRWPALDQAPAGGVEVFTKRFGIAVVDGRLGFHGGMTIDVDRLGWFASGGAWWRSGAHDRRPEIFDS
jgi:hypothetical protein